MTRGSNVGGLLRYLYGPGKANEHVNPHLVASWRGDDRAGLDQLEPVPDRRGRYGVVHLADRLDLPLHLLPEVADKQVWQCSMRMADGDRGLTDAEWALVAREVVEKTGFAPDGDPGGCRWVAGRHADDHIHVVVVLARQDGQPVNSFRDWPKVHAAARSVEQRLGLTTVMSPDRSATVAPSRGEVAKAQRRGRPEPVRTWLAREVRVAAAGSASLQEFEQVLGQRPELVVGWRYSQQNPGQITGYRVGRRGDIDAGGKQVWFSGSKLSPDLSLPEIEARWREVASRGQASGAASAARSKTLDRASAALVRASAGAVPANTAISAAEIANVVARGVEGKNGGPLTLAAEELSRAARRPGGARPPARITIHDLRYIATDLARMGPFLPSEAGDVLLIVADLARIASILSHRAEAADPRRAASRRALGHFARYAGPVGAEQVAQIRAGLSEPVAASVLADPAWPALAAQLRRLEAHGVEPSAALAAALRSREITSASSVAQVMHYRLTRLPLPENQAVAGQARPASGRPGAEPRGPSTPAAARRRQ